MAKRTLKPVKYHDPVFQTEYLIYYGWPVEDYIKAVDKSLGIDVSEARGWGGQMCETTSTHPCGGSTKRLLIWTREKHPHVLAHECLHAALCTLRCKGVPASYDNEEIVCYMMDHLIQKGLGA